MSRNIVIVDIKIKFSFAEMITTLILFIRRYRRKPFIPHNPPHHYYLGYTDTSKGDASTTAATIATPITTSNHIDPMLPVKPVL